MDVGEVERTAGAELGPIEGAGFGEGVREVLVSIGKEWILFGDKTRGPAEAKKHMHGEGIVGVRSPHSVDQCYKPEGGQVANIKALRVR